ATLDDAVGESYDKVARVMGIGYPGGPIVDKLYYKGNKEALKIPEPKVDGYDFSFSGIKTSVINAVNKARMKGEDFKPEDLSASFQGKVVDILCKKTLKAVQDKGVKQVVIAGGVAANSLLRTELTKRAEKIGVKVSYPSMSYCTDNAAMIAAAAYYKLNYGKGQIFADLTLNGKATLDIMKD
ncbi:MAG: tRNA (adenosine(37)-N6)-threonylcarbamoyltransferase complex transferase subunit TsaD, partial [Cetobacterium sp.]